MAWDGGFEEDFVVPVMDLMREFLEKTAGGWKPCKLDELEEFKFGPMGLSQKLRREVEKREREKVRIFGENDILPFWSC